MHMTPELGFPLFIKPVAEGTGKGVDLHSIVHDWQGLDSGCQRLWKAFRQPVLVEEFLPGREFTVGILGTGERAEVLGTLEIVLRQSAEPNVYSYTNKEQSEERVDYPLVSGTTDATVGEAEAIALDAWRALGGRDAGRIDLRCDAAGRPQFIEVNPLAGLHPWHSDLPMLCTAVGMPYVELIRRIVQSAAERVARPKHRGKGAGHARAGCA
jgi:D-alanine-D-alanine ligase